MSSQTTSPNTQNKKSSTEVENEGLPSSKYPYLSIIVTAILLVLSVGLTFIMSRVFITLIGLENNPLRFIIYGIILFACLTLAGIAYMIYYISINKSEIQKNWASYRCRPYIIPFVGVLKKVGVAPSNVVVSENYAQCSHSMFEAMFEIAMAPFISIIGKQNTVLKGIIDDMNQSRKVIYYMRDNIKKANRDIYLRLYETYSRLAALFNVVKKYIYLIIKLFKDLFGILIFSAATMASVWNGPIMGVAEFFCFPGETFINMDNGEYKMIKDINIGDILQDGSYVIGCHKVCGKGMQMYSYQNNNHLVEMFPNKQIHVSGSHLVYENNIPIRVEDSQYATKVNDVYNYVYCLETSNSKININDVIFADYSETKDTRINNMIQTIILEHLNNKHAYRIHTTNQSYNWGFNKDTLIDMLDGSKKPIEDIKIGDKLIHSNIVGISQLSATDVKMYNYKGIILSGTTIVNENGLYIPVYKSEYAIDMTANSHTTDVIFNLITNNNKIYINNIEFTDYVQDSDNCTNIYIDTLVETFIKITDAYSPKYYLSNV